MTGGRKKESESAVIVTVVNRHMPVSAPLKAHAEEKASKLTKYYDRIQEIEVILDAKSDKGPVDVEMIVNGEKKKLFIATERGDDAYKCIDACVLKLERQLSDHHKQQKNRKHP